MWFLIKGSFWFGLVLVALSFFSGERPKDVASQPTSQFSDAFVAATGAYDYMSGLCGEKPEVCAKGADTMAALGHRARRGALVAFEMLDSRFGGAKNAKETTAATTAPFVELAPAQTASSANRQVHEERAVALNQPMPYRPPVEDGNDDASDQVTTSTIPLPTPRPAI
jgi:hypothetical protein